MSGPRSAAGAVLALLALACTGSQPPPVPRPPPGPARIQANGPYSHVLTGFVFPVRVGPFVRTRITRYDPDAYNVSGHYRLREEAPTIATVYHYPATADGSPPGAREFRRQFESAAGDVVLRTPGGTHFPDSRHAATINGFTLRGWKALYRFPSFHAYEEPVESTLFLFVAGGWYIKFRFSYPLAEATRIAPLTQTFMESFTWPLPGR